MQRLMVLLQSWLLVEWQQHGLVGSMLLACLLSSAVAGLLDLVDLV
jgi:hypothetical protein